MIAFRFIHNNMSLHLSSSIKTANCPASFEIMQSLIFEKYKFFYLLRWTHTRHILTWLSSWLLDPVLGMQLLGITLALRDKVTTDEGFRLGESGSLLASLLPSLSSIQRTTDSTQFREVGLRNLIIQKAAIRTWWYLGIRVSLWHCCYKCPLKITFQYNTLISNRIINTWNNEVNIVSLSFTVRFNMSKSVWILSHSVIFVSL